MSEMHKLTSYSDGFGIFNKVAEHEFDVDNKNYLRLFMLNTENKLFNYDELYEYLLPNIARYVFDRKRLAEAEKNPVKQSLILIEAIEHLRKITSDKDRGAGGELGEVLLYLFLEQDLKAPKLFSKVELKTSNMDYVKGSDGIHLFIDEAHKISDKDKRSIIYYKILDMLKERPFVHIYFSDIQLADIRKGYFGKGR